MLASSILVRYLVCYGVAWCVVCGVQRGARCDAMRCDIHGLARYNARCIALCSVWLTLWWILGGMWYVVCSELVSWRGCVGVLGLALGMGGGESWGKGRGGHMRGGKGQHGAAWHHGEDARQGCEGEVGHEQVSVLSHHSRV